MKGFDVAQGIPRAGEAAVHAEVLDHLRNSSIPFVGSKTKLWGRRAQADFVLGYSRTFLSHTVELESVTTWQVGLTQALWYKSAYFHECRVQATPTLILFGDVSAQRWNEIDTTCLDQRVLVVPFRLFVDGSAAQRDLLDLLR